MRFIGRRERRRRRAARADGRGPRSRPRPTTASRSSSPSTTAGGRRSSTRRERYTGGGEDAFRALLYAPEMHDPDLIIRTSGEQRMSQLPALAARVLRARLPRRAVARLHARGVRGLARGVRRPAGAGSGAADGAATARPARRRPPRRARRNSGSDLGARGSSRRSRRSRFAIVHRRARAGWSSPSGWSLLGHRLPARAVRDVRRARTRSRLAGFLGLVGLLVAGALRRRRTPSCWSSCRRSRWCSCSCARAAPRAARPACRSRCSALVLGRPGVRPRRAAARPAARRRRSSSTCSSARSSATPAPTSAAARSGARRWRRAISPNKTVEGLVDRDRRRRRRASWFAGLYQDWLGGSDALLLGVAVAIAAPLGDLFESYLKRDAGTKDTGTLFGAHGGALDRLDAVLFAAVAGFYVWQALL